jgi:hypothetical protein
MVKRTSKNYDGTSVPAKKLADLLSQFMAGVSQKKEDSKELISQYWFEILGEKMGPMTEVISFLDGVLTVKVKSSTLYSLLCQHEKPRLLRRLQERFKICNIVLKIG